MSPPDVVHFGICDKIFYIHIDKRNVYGYICYVFDLLWFLRDLKVATVYIGAHLMDHFSWERTAQFKLCNNC